MTSDSLKAAVERFCRYCGGPLPCLTHNEYSPITVRSYSMPPVVEPAAREVEELRAERDLLQEILDSRPAINADLPDSYIHWSRSIYSGDLARAIISKLKGEEDVR